jgi:hypothetical protein
MYGKTAYKDTVYFEYVKANVVSMLGQGKGAYDLKELAALIGLKPTHNFKRRLHQLVDLGVIAAEVAYTETGSMKAVFMLPEVVKEIQPPSW